MIKVHGVALSPFVRKLMLALEYKGLAYENVSVFPGAEDPDFRAISPLGKVPVFEEDGYTLADTSVICRYVDRIYPEKPIYPEDPKLEAQACWLEEFADSKLIEACAGLFQERFLNPNMLGQPTNEERVQDLLNNQLPKLLDYLESQTPDSGPMVGDSVSIADLAILTCFLQARYGDFEVDGGTHPKLRAYLDTAFSNEVVQNRIAQEQEVVKGLAG
jgi:glutathione S-transferase